jgi:hypothetical protein
VDAVGGKQLPTSSSSLWLLVGVGAGDIVLIATVIGRVAHFSPSCSLETIFGSSFSSEQEFRTDDSSADPIAILTLGIGTEEDIQTNGTTFDTQSQMNLADDAGESAPGIASAPRFLSNRDIHKKERKKQWFSLRI